MPWQSGQTRPWPLLISGYKKVAGACHLAGTPQRPAINGDVLDIQPFGEHGEPLLEGLVECTRVDAVEKALAGTRRIDRTLWGKRSALVPVGHEWASGDD